MKPRIAITLGDPAGIGPEIVFKALRDPRVRKACVPVLLGSSRRIPMGRPSRQGGLRAIEALEQGFSLVRSGQAEALVTAPVSKESFHLADYGYPGHTEWLGRQCRTPRIAMLMVSGPLRSILLTRHIPLVKVAAHISGRSIQAAAQLGGLFVRACLHKPRPRLVLCGLNPHAGDHGLIGQEEKNLMGPALRALRRKGIAVEGPTPSDTAFLLMARGRFDLALAAYHDQAMIPLKLFDSERLVNITLGLPFIRTSPGHGTAYDIAGKGIARPGAMIEAILLAARYASARL